MLILLISYVKSYIFIYYMHYLTKFKLIYPQVTIQIWEQTKKPEPIAPAL